MNNIVTREEFNNFVSNNPALLANPVEGNTISVMEYTDPNTARLIASATYTRIAGKISPVYRIY